MAAGYVARQKGHWDVAELLQAFSTDPVIAASCNCFIVFDGDRTFVMFKRGLPASLVLRYSEENPRVLHKPIFQISEVAPVATCRTRH